MVDFGENGEIAKLVYFGENCKITKLVDFGENGEITKLVDFGENGEIAKLVDFGENGEIAKLVDLGENGERAKLVEFGNMVTFPDWLVFVKLVSLPDWIVWTIRRGKEWKGKDRKRGRKGKEGMAKVINFRSHQAILIRMSHSLCNIPNFVHTKSFTDFETGQTDRRTDNITGMLGYTLYCNDSVRILVMAFIYFLILSNTLCPTI